MISLSEAQCPRAPHLSRHRSRGTGAIQLWHRYSQYLDKELVCKKKLQSLGSLLTKPPIVQTFVDNFQCESCRTSSAVLSLSMYINVTDGDLYGWVRRCCCILHLDTDLKFSGPAPGRKYQRCCLYRTLTSNCCSQIESATYEHDMITYGPGPGCLVPGSGSMLIYLILIINSSLTPELGWAVPCPCHAKWRG